MNVLIPLTQFEEARLNAAAKQTGVTPAELIKRLALQQLLNLSGPSEDGIDAQLSLWQEQDGTPLMPNVAAQTLFAEWAEEDAKMTVEERVAEDRLWEDIEQSLGQDRGIELRRLGS